MTEGPRESAIVREAIVLAGGEASRLGAIAAEVPKALLPVAGRPFLDYVLLELKRHGVRRVVLATGRLHEVVERHVGDGSRFGLEVEHSVEAEPLGTGGAIALAARSLDGPLAYVCNGDSLLDCNLLALAGLLRRDPAAEVAVALRHVAEAARFGSVRLEPDGHVRGFGEKSASGPGLVNGGVYCVRTALLRSLPAGRSSLEYDAFPALAASGRMLGMRSDGVFVDIGLPDSLEAAQDAVAAWRHRPCAFLDRDGVINEDTGHVHAPEQFRFLPGMPDAIRALNDAGWLVVVTTNQAGIGRGYYTEDEFSDFTAWIDEQLAAWGAHIDATYHCPHHPTAGIGEYLRSCECRKPAPGMLLRAIDEWEPDVGRSVMIGDSETDMLAAQRAGVRGVLHAGGDVLGLVEGIIAADRAVASHGRADR